MHRQSLLWAPFARKALNVAIIRSDGSVKKDDDEKAAELAKFWGKTFEAKQIDTADAQAFLNEFAADFSFQSSRPPDQSVIEGFLARARHSAAGPDGLPYSAWRAAGSAGLRILFRVQFELMAGTMPPDGFNDSLGIYLRRVPRTTTPLFCPDGRRPTLDYCPAKIPTIRFWLAQLTLS